MHVEFDIPSADTEGRVFLTWTPVEALARLVDGPRDGAAVPVTLRNAGAGGQLLFQATAADPGSGTLVLVLQADGTPVAFRIAGLFQRPSLVLGDAVTEAVAADNATVLGSQPMTVRVRKNAESLTAEERDRFLTALGALNGSGAGRFRDFRDMHVSNARPEAHGNVGFLAWHRAYLLDLERELQAIDPRVTLPYWRFDQPAPSLFSLQFLGLPNRVGSVQFSAGHPLSAWRTDGQPGINRGMSFRPNAAPRRLRTEDQTLALGGVAPNAIFRAFDNMEGNPHGSAHTTFRGFITSIGTAARDPLFFMLHANVDRLWAKWQWLNHRADPDDPDAFAPARPNRIGHRLDDTMWPWNGDTNPPRPSTAPGGGLASSPVTSAPGASPTVRSMLDFQGAAGSVPLGFAYDDVPFER
jgi:tyrosinase